MVFICAICDKDFAHKNSVSRHIQRTHLNKVGRHKLRCTECDFDCRYYEHLRIHLHESHGIACPFKRMTFSSLKEFKVWKKSYERRTCYLYVKQSSPKVFCGMRKTYFVCHRTGRYKSNGSGARKLKLIGSNKINATCVSTIELAESFNSDNVYVKFWGTHTGHRAEIRRTSLQKKEIKWIEDRLAADVPVQKIKNEILNTKSASRRLTMITDVDLRNIRRRRALVTTRTIFQQLRDWISGPLMRWLKRMRYRSNKNKVVSDQGPILLMEESWDTDHVPPAYNFTFAMMSRHQARFFEDAEMVCAFITPVSKLATARLLTVAVRRCSEWYAAVYGLTMSANESILRRIVRAIHERVGTVRCTAFFGDMEPAFRDAWIAEMGAPERCSLNIWAVEMDWKRLLNELKCTPSVRNSLLTSLSSIADEPDPDIFQARICSLSTEMMRDVRLTTFRQRYVDNCMDADWAACRKLAREPRDLYEQLNRKFDEQLRRPNMARFVCALFRIAHEGIKCRYKWEEVLSDEHDVDVEMTITQRSDGVYDVLRESSVYEVRASQTRCLCAMKCRSCDVCPHRYTCTCLPYSLDSCLCAHIHACAQYASANQECDVEMYMEEVIDIYDPNETGDNCDDIQDGRMSGDDIPLALDRKFSNNEIDDVPVGLENDSNLFDLLSSTSLNFPAMDPILYSSLVAVEMDIQKDEKIRLNNELAAVMLMNRDSFFLDDSLNDAPENNEKKEKSDCCSEKDLSSNKVDNEVLFRLESDLPDHMELSDSYFDMFDPNTHLLL